MKKIGRYIVRGLLGRGGMAKVLKVELAPIGKIAALKLFDPDPMLVRLMGPDRLRDLFVGEALTVARIEHPHIVAIHDFDHYQEKPFYVMGYAANNLGILMGESYRVELPSRVIDMDKALRYTRQTLDGLACLHDAGIIHRDIKPFNLLLDARDQVQICDFGLSKPRGEAFGGPANLNVGSPYYASPEQEAQPDGIDPRADLYPVGIMLYRMLTGHLPRAATTQSAYQPPSAFNANLDAVWDGFIATAIHPHPSKRFSNALAMLEALGELVRHWETVKDKTCGLMPKQTAATDSGATRHTASYRQSPIKADPKRARDQFHVDTLWRPTTDVPNHFEIQSKNLVVDHATGLTWQQGGSAYPRTWHQAQTYIEGLNTGKLTGDQKWRLPTVDELLTLLHPAAENLKFCIAPLFDTTQRWLWSADRRSFMAAYYADIELGFIGWQDFSAPFYVRAVCSLRG